MQRTTLILNVGTPGRSNTQNVSIINCVVTLLNQHSRRETGLLMISTHIENQTESAFHIFSI